MNPATSLKITPHKLQLYTQKIDLPEIDQKGEHIT